MYVVCMYVDVLIIDKDKCKQKRNTYFDWNWFSNTSHAIMRRCKMIKLLTDVWFCYLTVTYVTVILFANAIYNKINHKFVFSFQFRIQHYLLLKRFEILTSWGRRDLGEGISTFPRFFYMNHYFSPFGQFWETFVEFHV